MPLKFIIEKDLKVRSNRTGSKEDMKRAMQASAAGKITSKIEILKLEDLNLAMDRIKAGKVLGKLVVDLRP